MISWNHAVNSCGARPSVIFVYCTMCMNLICLCCHGVLPYHSFIHCFYLEPQSHRSVAIFIRITEELYGSASSTLSINHRWESTSILTSAISDIRHQHLLFRYRKKICRTENWHSNIGRVPKPTSESIPILYLISRNYFSHPLDLNLRP